MYTYALNNPIRYVDPTGHVTVDVNGQIVGNAQLVNGTTTGNLTDVITGLGGTTTWNESTKTATVFDFNQISNGVGYASDDTIENGKIQIGVRDVSERVGNSSVSWDASTFSVMVTSSNRELVNNLNPGLANTYQGIVGGYAFTEYS